MKCGHQFWPWSWAWFWIFQFKSGNGCISGMAGLIGVKWKGSKSIVCPANLWPHIWPWPWIFRIQFLDKLSSGMGGPIMTLIPRYMSQSIMTMTMTLRLTWQALWMYWILVTRGLQVSTFHQLTLFWKCNFPIYFTVSYLEHLWNCWQMNVTEHLWW